MYNTPLQNCYVTFPTWPLETSPRISPRRPKYDDFYIPAVPPYKTSEDNTLDGVADWFKMLQDSQNFTQTKDALKFRLELAGFAKDEVSVTVGENKFLNVNSKNGQKPYNKVFTIPNAEDCNLSDYTAKMENGLLEISFAAKKEEVRAIKIL